MKNIRIQPDVQELEVMAEPEVKEIPCRIRLMVGVLDGGLCPGTRAVIS